MTKKFPLDKQNMYESIESLAKQINQAWNEVSKIQIPWKQNRDIDNIVVTAMGGSNLGTDLLRHPLFSNIKVPLVMVNDYHLPEFVNGRTLVIVISYSGNTEETLSCLNEAISKKCRIFGISTGGKLQQIMLKEGMAGQGYFFVPKYNPCNQPRIGIGYVITAELYLLKNVCDINYINDNYINKLISHTEKLNEKFGILSISKNNAAKSVAEKMKGSIPLLVAAEHLIGNSHVMSNQINENTKNFCTYFAISELNHHLLESMQYPKINSKLLRFLFIESDLYSIATKSRISITKDVLRKNHIKFTEFRATSETKLDQSFEVLSFGAYVSFYFAMFNKLNPTPIPWVDYFKDQLAKIEK